MNCPCCETSVDSLDPFFHLDNAYLSVAWLPKTAGQGSGRGTLSLVECPNCHFVFNRGFDQNGVNEMYLDTDYVLKTNASPSMSGTLKKVFEFVSPHFPAGRVLEVAPGNGALSYALASQASEVITVDPAESAQASMQALDRENIRHIRGFFDVETVESHVDGKFQLVAARHLIEHLARPLDFLKQVRGVLADEGRVYLELPNFTEILNSGRVYDLFHDHFGYFSPETFKNTAQAAGLSVVDQISLFGDQHMGFVLKPSEVSSIRSLGALWESGDLRAFQTNRELMNGCLDEEAGELAVWGGGAHGNAFLNGLEANQRNRFTTCIDKDPSKSGRFLQNSRAQVRVPTGELVNQYNAIVIAASLYEDEILKELRSLGFNGKVLKTAVMGKKGPVWDLPA